MSGLHFHFGNVIESFTIPIRSSSVFSESKVFISGHHYLLEVALMTTSQSVRPIWSPMVVLATFRVQPPLHVATLYKTSISSIFKPEELSYKPRGNFVCLWTPCPSHPKVHEALSISDSLLVSVNHLFGTVNQWQDWQTIQIASKIEIMWMDPLVEPWRPS